MIVSGAARAAEPATRFDAADEIARLGWFNIGVATMQPARAGEAPLPHWIVLSNGSDVSSQPVLAFSLSADNSYPSSPTWASDDSCYSAGVQVADMDRDGYEDIVIACFADTRGRLYEGGVKVYRGGRGGPSTTPVWIGPRFSASDIAIVDLDADGDQDVVVSSLWEDAPPSPLRPLVPPEKVPESPQASSATLGPLGNTRFESGSRAWRPKFRPTRHDGVPDDIDEVVNGQARLLTNWSTRAFMWFRSEPLDELEGIAALDAADVDADGVVDLLAGGRKGLFFLKGTRPRTRGVPFEVATHRKVATDFVYDVDVGGGGSAGGLIIAATASCLDASDVPCKAASGFLAGTAAEIFTERYAADVRSIEGETPAAVGWADVDGKGSLDLVVGLWPSGDCLAVGTSVLAYAGEADGVAARIGALPTRDEHFVMGADIVTADLFEPERTCPAVVHQVTLPVSAGSSRASYTTPVGRLERVRSVVVRDGNASHVYAESWPRSGPRHYSVDSRRRTLTLSPPAEENEVIEIQFETSGSPDLLVANANPLGGAAVWRHRTCSTQHGETHVE